MSDSSLGLRALGFKAWGLEEFRVEGSGVQEFGFVGLGRRVQPVCDFGGGALA